MAARDLNAAAERRVEPTPQKKEGIQPIKSSGFPPITLAPKTPRPIPVPVPDGKTRKRPGPSGQIMEQMKEKVRVSGPASNSANLTPLNLLKAPPPARVEQFQKRDDIVAKGAGEEHLIQSVEHRPVPTSVSKALDSGQPPPPPPPLIPPPEAAKDPTREPPVTMRPKLSGAVVKPQPRPPGPSGI